VDALIVADADAVRAAIAFHCLGHRAGGKLGGIELHPHQVEAVARLERLLALHRGALLADEVGLGKTYVALAVATRYRAVLVIGPAGLRRDWNAAAAAAGVGIRYVSNEALSRGALPPSPTPELVVVDEAHHLRTAGTRRFALAAELCRAAHVLLLTATPVQNRLADLRTILSLFLGVRAHAAADVDLASYVVRRSHHDIAEHARLSLPTVRAPRWLAPIEDVDCLDRLVALPPPLPPVDGDDGGALLTYTLVRQWSSSRAALRGALRRRLARGMAMEDAVRAGRLPSRAELCAWCFADDAQQLSFPELVVAAGIEGHPDLLPRLSAHLAALRSLLAWLDATPDPDRARADAIQRLARERDGHRVVAFSEYAETVAGLYRLLRPTLRVAMLSHHGGRVAGGPISRAELLSRFAPGAASRTHPGSRIDLLLTTDVLSEGVNLQDASVVIHLDLAWNPARLEQRVGRLRRIGASHSSIEVCLLPPPAHPERFLRLEQRLRAKLAVAGRSVGVAGAILPTLQPAALPGGDAAREERIARRLGAWRRDAGSLQPLAAGALSPNAGGIACVRRDGGVMLVAITPARITEDRAVVEALLADASGPNVPLRDGVLAQAVDRLEHWLRRDAILGVVDPPALRVAGARRAVLHRAAAIGRRTPRHARWRVAPLMSAARTAATATLSAGAERVLDELSHATMSDAAWLQAVGEFAALHASRPTAPPGEILALLILQPG
jgi:hypothetical protein